jgi:alpha-tubulin suppressor-like RCC1 family protein
VTALALGAYHGCVVRADASVWCWGQNTMRQLGREGAGAAQPVPGVAARALGAGPFRTCALTTDSTIMCWGDNEHGAAGAEPSERYVFPTLVEVLP